ncbi:hypothetical protein C8R46DRAFT_1184379 [Mycena filopes]|nr:hypothetical protein C8R46DRAFT_1184379 [Mycena filopes]
MTDLDILADPADSAPSEYPHGHALSDKSEALQRDTYFFSSGHPTRLVLGFNQKLTPLSSAKLHRWTDLMSGWKQGFYICPVSVKPCGVMVYSISPSGPVIDVDSEELLPPGNYGWYCDRILSTSGLIMLAGVEASARNTSFEYHVTVDRHEGFLGPYEIPADIARVVVVRDQRACRVTGSTNDTVSTWIVPPTWAWTTIPLRPPRKRIHAAQRPQSTLLQPFAVDVDDDYRIVVLRDLGADHARLLPTHLSHPRNDTADADAEFFRLHLRYSFNFMLLGGDITERYPPYRVLSEMAALGVAPDSEEGDMARLDDPRWQSELGKAILAEELRSRAAMSLYYSGRDEEDARDAEYDRWLEVESAKLLAAATF